MSKLDDATPEELAEIKAIALISSSFTKTAANLLDNDTSAMIVLFTDCIGRTLEGMGHETSGDVAPELKKEIAENVIRGIVVRCGMFTGDLKGSEVIEAALTRKDN